MSRRTQASALMSNSDRIALRICDAVAASGLSRSTLYVLISQGELRAVKAGGRRLILRSDLEAYLHGLTSSVPR